MFQLFKAEAKPKARMRLISRTSWRDKILIGVLTVALGKMGVTACYSGWTTLSTIGPDCFPGNGVSSGWMYSPSSIYGCEDNSTWWYSGCTSAQVALSKQEYNWFTSNCEGLGVAVGNPVPLGNVTSARSYLCSWDDAHSDPGS